MSSMADIVRDLNQCSLFKGVLESDLEKISDLCEGETYKKGCRLFDDSDPADTLFLIRTGIVTIHLFSITPAYDITITKLFAGDVLGEFSLLKNKTRQTAATSLEEVEVWKIDTAKLKELIVGDSELGFVIMSNLSDIMSERIKARNRRILNMTRSSLF